jgi:hypothetical protein
MLTLAMKHYRENLLRHWRICGSYPLILRRLSARLEETDAEDRRLVRWWFTVELVQHMAHPGTDTKLA